MKSNNIEIYQQLEYQGHLQIMYELWKITNRPFNREIIFDLYEKLIDSFKEGGLI